MYDIAFCFKENKNSIMKTHINSHARKVSPRWKISRSRNYSNLINVLGVDVVYFGIV